MIRSPLLGSVCRTASRPLSIYSIFTWVNGSIRTGHGLDVEQSASLAALSFLRINVAVIYHVRELGKILILFLTLEHAQHLESQNVCFLQPVLTLVR
jgi:hypothetical protein